VIAEEDLSYSAFIRLGGSRRLPGAILFSTKIKSLRRFAKIFIITIINEVNYENI